MSENNTVKDASAGTRQSKQVSSLVTPPFKSDSHSDATDVNIRSDYLVNRLFSTKENNLFNYVKFHMVSSALQKYAAPHPKVLDIGCGLQVARTFLNALLPSHDYFGVDYEEAFQPDAVVDLFDSDSLELAVPAQVDAVLALDVLEHLTDDIPLLEESIGNIARNTPDNAIVIVTLPQMYRLDRLKLAHLHYPEHKIRRTQQEWLGSLEKHFDILEVRGLGFLSVLPYLPMLSKKYSPENRLGKLFLHLRSKTFEHKLLKPADLFLSNTFGRIPGVNRWTNDFLVIARPK